MKKCESHGWMMYRLQRLPDTCSTKELMRHLKISETVLRRWLADPRFRELEIAENINGSWRWNCKLLRPWAIAMLRLKPSKYVVHENPDLGYYPTPEKAAEKLGLPSDYRSYRCQNPKK